MAIDRHDWLRQQAARHPDADGDRERVFVPTSLTPFLELSMAAIAERLAEHRAALQGHLDRFVVYDGLDATQLQIFKSLVNQYHVAITELEWVQSQLTEQPESKARTLWPKISDEPASPATAPAPPVASTLP